MNLQAVDRYEKGAELLAAAAQGLTEEQLHATPGPGAWSIAELLSHMADCEVAHAMRFRQVIAEDRPSLPAFDEDAWLARLDSKSMPADESTALFAINRRRMTRVFRGLSEADFARVGVHSDRGPQTLAELVAIAAGHVDHHLKFLYAKRANLGVALYPRYTTD